MCQVDGKQHQIDLTLTKESNQKATSSVAAAQAKPGDILMGKVVKGKGKISDMSSVEHTLTRIFDLAQIASACMEMSGCITYVLVFCEPF